MVTFYLLVLSLIILIIIIDYFFIFYLSYMLSYNTNHHIIFTIYSLVLIPNPSFISYNTNHHIIFTIYSLVLIPNPSAIANSRGIYCAIVISLSHSLSSIGPILDNIEC